VFGSVPVLIRLVSLFLLFLGSDPKLWCLVAIISVKFCVLFMGLSFGFGVLFIGLDRFWCATGFGYVVVRFCLVCYCSDSCVAGFCRGLCVVNSDEQ